MVVYGL